MTRKAYGEKLASSLKQQRIGLQLTQLQVAIGIGVSESSISRWETGERVMDACSYDKLRQFFKEQWAAKQAAVAKQAGAEVQG